MVTSKIESSLLDGDILLSEWAKEGLLHPSLARLAKIAPIDADLIEKKLGTLTKKTTKQLK